MKNAAMSTTANGDATDDSEPVCHDVEITRQRRRCRRRRRVMRELEESFRAPNHNLMCRGFLNQRPRPIFGLLTARFGLNHFSKSRFPSTQRQNFLDVITALSSATL